MNKFGWIRKILTVGLVWAANTVVKESSTITSFILSRTQVPIPLNQILKCVYCQPGQSDSLFYEIDINLVQILLDQL